MTPNKRPMKKKRRLTWDAVKLALRSRTAGCVYIVVIGTLALCILFLLAITPERYSLNVGDIAHTTITASKDVVDEISTARQREEAAKQVEPSYQFKEGVSGAVMQNLASVLAQVNAVQQLGNQVLEQYAPEDLSKQAKYVFTDAEIENAKEMLTQLSLANYQIVTLLHASDEQMKSMSDNLSSAVENTLNTTIREGYVNESIQYLQQIVGYKTDMDLLQNVVTPILRKVIQPNMIIDQEATAKLQDEARAAVEPVIYKQGQNIVLARERVTANQLEMLRSLGLLDSDDVDIVMYLGGILMVLLSVSMLCLTLVLFAPGTLSSPKRLTIVMLTLVLTMGVCVVGQIFNSYLTPALLCAMMLTGLLGSGAAVSGSLCISILVSALIAGGDSNYGAVIVNLLYTTLLSSILSIMVLRKKPQRQQVLLCGILAALGNIVIILTVGFMTNTSIPDVFTNALWSAGSALIASVLCIAFDPMIESVFNLATPAKLLELSNPNHPILRRLLIEASGTYHHSIIVANLAEAAAEAIGANPLLARVGAYFHDIGKLKRPLYFKENQIGEDPHEHTNPYVSAAIVTAHTRDGLITAQQCHLPKEIQDIIIEHHGDTPVMFFYHKALQQTDGQPVDIADFRYDGRRPRTKESAIIMLADTVEAAVRSMPDPTPQGISDFITRLVKGKLDDNQLSDAPITLKDITAICNAFSTVLNGVFHERIEYPSISPSAAAHVAARLGTPEESPVEEKELHRIGLKDAEREAQQAIDEAEGESETKETAGEPDAASALSADDSAEAAKGASAQAEDAAQSALDEAKTPAREVAPDGDKAQAPAASAKGGKAK